MDNLTHTLIGVAVASAGLRQRLGRGTTAVLAIASNLPDIDAVYLFFGGEYGFLARRMLTHSILGILVLSLLAAWVFRFFYRELSYKALFFLCLLGMGLHVFYDLMNSYGVVLLYPFSHERFELAWIFIIDLVLWFLLILPFILLKFKKLKSKECEIFKVTVLAVGLYTGFCGWARFESFRVLERTAEYAHIHPDFFYVFPEAFGSHRFRGIVRKGDDYEMYLIHVFQGQAELLRRLHTQEKDPRIQGLRQRREVHNLEWFAKAPVWQIVEKNGQLIAKAFDLRFVSLVLKGRKASFAFQFMVPDSSADSDPPDEK